jgi:hypothetical protein
VLEPGVIGRLRNHRLGGALQVFARQRHRDRPERSEPGEDDYVAHAAELGALLDDQRRHSALDAKAQVHRGGDHRRELDCELDRLAYGRCAQRREAEVAERRDPRLQPQAEPEPGLAG